MADPQAPDRYAVIGWPVEHSQSPFIHARFAEQTDQHMVYGRIACRPTELPDVLRRFCAAGPGQGLARGCNLTVPLKFDSVRLAAACSAPAQLALAGNVLELDTPGWRAHNTDGIGLVRDIEHGAGVALAGARVLLIGAGGAAAGVLGPLLERSPRALRVVNRTLERATELVQRHAALAARCGADLQAAGLGDAGQGWDIVLNASASSLAGASTPVAASTLRPGTLALDLMYGPAAEPFMAWARAHGAHGRDGLGMLVEQAAEAFAIWRGLRPQTAPVLAALRQRTAA